MSREVDALVAELRFADAARLAASGGDHPRAAVLLGLADELAAMRDALARLSSAERATAGAELARRGRDGAAAVAWEAAGELERAERGFVRARDLAAAARVAMARGDEDAAAAHLQARLAVAPDDDDAIVTLASLQLARGLAGDAASTASRVGPASPARARALALIDRALDGADAARAGRGRYLELVEVATSPVARVLRGRDALTGRDVALKVLRASCGADARRRLADEARAQASLRHPHVVPLLDVDEESGVIVTPWMSGGSLRDAVATGPLSAARVAEIIAAIADALGAAHATGLVHRDVTAANVLFDGAGAAHLADFGAAHARDDAATVTAGLTGTLSTMAPEVRRGAPATPASDVYSLGRVLTLALSGSDDDPRAPSELGIGLGTAHDALVGALTHEDPSRRPDAARARASVLALAWPARAARRRAQPPPVPATALDALAQATATLPRTPATLAAARAVAAGCELGLAALPTVRALDADHVRVERVTGSAPERHARADDAADEARRYLSDQGVASVTLVSAHRGAVVVPIALMPR